VCSPPTASRNQPQWHSLEPHSTPHSAISPREHSLVQRHRSGRCRQEVKAELDSASGEPTWLEGEPAWNLLRHFGIRAEPADSLPAAEASERTALEVRFDPSFRSIDLSVACGEAPVVCITPLTDATCAKWWSWSECRLAVVLRNAGQGSRNSLKSFLALRHAGGDLSKRQIPTDVA